MKSSIVAGTILLRKSGIFRKNFAYLVLIFFSCFHFSELRSQNCKLCSIPSFPVLTVYQTFQTAHGMGFGVEAGNWNKDAGKFSYFLGTSLLWTKTGNADSKSVTISSETLLSFYVKGQYRITNHLYLIAAPGIVNLSFMELQTGLRYVVPLTSVIGLGIEPAYLFNQKQFQVHANLHFALR